MDQADNGTHLEQQPSHTETAPSTGAPPNIKDGEDKPALEKQKKKRYLKPTKQFDKSVKFISKYQVAVVLIVIGGLLALTALRMLHYSNPPANDARIQENLSKFKKIYIDQKTVQRIEQLQDSKVSPGTNIQNGRTNPFAE
jgi:hypothetical protein